MAKNWASFQPRTMTKVIDNNKWMPYIWTLGIISMRNDIVIHLIITVVHCRMLIREMLGVVLLLLYSLSTRRVWPRGGNRNGRVRKERKRKCLIAQIFISSIATSAQIDSFYEIWIFVNMRLFNPYCDLCKLACTFVINSKLHTVAWVLNCGHI